MIFDKKKINTYSMIGSRATFGLAMYDLAKEMEDLIVVTADVSTSAGLDRFRKTYLDRYIDVGIAEQNMMSIAAGMASEGLNVVTTTFAPFQTMRCLEQIKVNLGYMQNKVTMVGLASGLVLGPLGFTHCCIEDLSIMRTIPNINVISPADCLETAKVVEIALKTKNSNYIRLTGSSNAPKVYQEDYEFVLGEPIEILKGEDLTIFATGSSVYNAILASEILKKNNIYPTIINVHTLKPINKKFVDEYIKKSKLIFTIEEHNIIGGLGSAISEINSNSEYGKKHISIAIPNNYGPGGNYDFLMKKNKLDPESISERILYECNK